MAEKTLRVQGLRELNRAFSLADKELKREMRSALKEAAEPVRSLAEMLALGEIRKMTLPWSRMRVGVTFNSVYIAPVERGRRSKSRPSIRRPNLKELLLGRAMEPALAASQGQVVHTFEDLLDDVADLWGRAA